MKYDIEGFDAEFLQILANADIVLLLKDGISDLGELSDIPYDVLKELLYDDEIISLLKDKHYDFGEIYSIYVEYAEDSDDGIGDFSFISLYVQCSCSFLDVIFLKIVFLYSSLFHFFTTRRLVSHRRNKMVRVFKTFF